MGRGDIAKEVDIDVDGCKLGAERHDAQKANALAVRMSGVSFFAGSKRLLKLTGPHTVRASAPSEIAPSSRRKHPPRYRKSRRRFHLRRAPKAPERGSSRRERLSGSHRSCEPRAHVPIPLRVFAGSVRRARRRRGRPPCSELRARGFATIGRRRRGGDRRSHYRLMGVVRTDHGRRAVSRGAPRSEWHG